MNTGKSDKHKRKSKKGKRGGGNHKAAALSLMSRPGTSLRSCAGNRDLQLACTSFESGSELHAGNVHAARVPRVGRPPPRALCT